MTKNRLSVVFKPVWKKRMSVANITGGFKAIGLPFQSKQYSRSGICTFRSFKTKMFAQLDLSDDEDNLPLLHFLNQISKTPPPLVCHTLVHVIAESEMK